jgi:hypothetical protein
VVVLEKLKIFIVFHSVLDVEGEGEVFEDFELEFMVEVGHGVEEGFLVADDVVVDEMVVQSLLFDVRTLYEFAILERFLPTEHALVAVLLAIKVSVKVGLVCETVDSC